MLRSTMLWATTLCALLILPGCGTINSYASGCPGRYSGVRQDLDLIQSYGARPALDSEVDVGFDGALADAWDQVFVAFDVPLAAIADTLALPFTASLDPTPARPLAPGCGWAIAPPDAGRGAG